MSDKNLPAISKQVTELVLAGSLEHAAVLTAELVSITAEELKQDLGAICAEPPPPDGQEDRAALRTLADRLGQLERAIGGREHKPRRLRKLWGFATLGGRP